MYVLHVDDNPGFTDLTADMLTREHDQLTVETATTASEGLDRLAERDFDCIVSDYEMPGVDGIEFLERVRAEYPNLPFILYTGKGSEEVASEAISAGVTDYLQKDSGMDHYTLLVNRITNVVDSYRSQQKLAERNKELGRYKHMINSMQEAACIYDADGRFEVVNEYLADWYGMTPEALKGEDSNLIPLIQKQTDGDDPYQALLDGERETLAGEIEAEFADHGKAVLEYRLTPLMVDGVVDGIVGVARDITERKEREQELRRTKRAIDEAPVGITITDPDRQENPVIYANQRFQDLTGYAEEEILGRNCRFLQGDDTAPDGVTALREAIDAEKPVTVELRNYRKDGTEFWNRLSVAPVRDEEGEVTNFVGFQQDVTDRKHREQELERQNKRLEQFSRVVSHDLRNPLNVANGRLQLVQEGCENEHLDAVEQALERMEALIADLLTLASGGAAVADLTPIDLGAIAERCWANVQTGDATFDIAVDQTIRADENRLRQVFENLIRNAIDHGGDDVAVTIGDLDGGFYVEDTGPGIPSEERDAVFEVGYSTSDDGTGLGLSIVKHVVDAHGWDIRVTEGTEGGARFEITGIESATV